MGSYLEASKKYLKNEKKNLIIEDLIYYRQYIEKENFYKKKSKIKYFFFLKNNLYFDINH